MEEKVEIEVKPKKEKIRTMFCKGSPDKRLKQLKSSKESFSIFRTNRTTKIMLSNRRYVYCGSGGLSYKELNLQRQLKLMVLSNINKDERYQEYKEEKLTVRDVNYFKISDMVHGLGRGEIIEPCVSFDINMAYYKCAYNMGYITQEFFEKCLLLPKPIRLRLIGSMATKKRRCDYKDGKIIGEPLIDENIELRNVWFSIVRQVGLCMEYLSRKCGDNFIMYWVDGIYLKGKEEDYKEIIEETSKLFNFDFKTEYLNKIVYDFEESVASYRLLIYRKKEEDCTEERKKFKPFYLKKESDIYARTRFREETNLII